MINVLVMWEYITLLAVCQKITFKAHMGLQIAKRYSYSFHPISAKLQVDVRERRLPTYH